MSLKTILLCVFEMSWLKSCLSFFQDRTTITSVFLQQLHWSLSPQIKFLFRECLVKCIHYPDIYWCWKWQVRAAKISTGSLSWFNVYSRCCQSDYSYSSYVVNFQPDYCREALLTDMVLLVYCTALLWQDHNWSKQLWHKPYRGEVTQMFAISL